MGRRERGVPAGRFPFWSLPIGECLYRSGEKSNTGSGKKGDFPYISFSLLSQGEEKEVGGKKGRLGGKDFYPGIQMVKDWGF